MAKLAARRLAIGTRASARPVQAGHAVPTLIPRRRPRAPTCRRQRHQEKHRLRLPARRHRRPGRRGAGSSNGAGGCPGRWRGPPQPRWCSHPYRPSRHTRPERRRPLVERHAQAPWRRHPGRVRPRRVSAADLRCAAWPQIPHHPRQGTIGLPPILEEAATSANPLTYPRW